MIKILIVDDSPSEVAILKSILMKEKDFEIIGYAKNGKEAISITPLLKPDLITMDINMPIMDGLAATRYIMSHHPVPIVIISSRINDQSLEYSFKALDAGAVGVLEKPQNITSPLFVNQQQQIVDTIRSMSSIKVIKRRFNTKSKSEIMPEKMLSTKIAEPEILVMGSSVGGPQALKIILNTLPFEFNIPIAIVQHMTPGFIHGFVKWLDNNCALKVKVVENNEELMPGTVYLAPDDLHFEIKRVNGNLVARLSQQEAISGFIPSITALFHSVATTCGKNAIGILLTGMGNDGAKGLLEMKQEYAHTIIQDKESSVVFGMAGVAQSLGAADKIMPLDQIGDYILKMTKTKTFT